MTNSFKYDFIIVGAGFAGASCARLLTDKGYKCLVIEKRPFVSGNCVTDRKNDIDIHFFGAHILHTDNEDVWNFLKIYTDIHEDKYRFVAWNNGEIYPIPFGMDLLNKIYNKAWPHECFEELKNDIEERKSEDTIEDYSISRFGNQIYNKTIANFYSKQFNEDCSKLPLDCMYERSINPIRFLNSYYQEKFQGVPENGYTSLIENMLGDDIDVLLNTDFLNNKEKYIKIAKYIVYTGELDRFFNYSMGPLKWIAIDFKFRDESDKSTNLSGIPVVHFTDNSIKWYRMTEHKWLTPYRDSEDFNNHTFISYEFYKDWNPGDESYLLIRDQQSINLNKRYKAKLKEKYPNIFCCGGRPNYQNLNICETIEYVMDFVNQF